MRVKICGITTLKDALAAIELGADALGFVFYPPSPRAVTPSQAQAIITQLPPFVTMVGLFVNTPIEQVNATVAQVGIDLVQFHGDESAVECEQSTVPYIRALRMDPAVDIAQLAKQYTGARAILLDAWVPGIPGGTGESFDWAAIPELNKPLVLAGGLTPENIRCAIDTVKPFAVDVSGGVELSKGVKNHTKLKLFIQLAKSKSLCGM